MAQAWNRPMPDAYGVTLEARADTSPSPPTAVTRKNLGGMDWIAISAICKSSKALRARRFTCSSFSVPNQILILKIGLISSAGVLRFVESTCRLILGEYTRN